MNFTGIFLNKFLQMIGMMVGSGGLSHGEVEDPFFQFIGAIRI